MSLYIETEGNINFPFDVREIAEMVVDAALEYIDCPYEAEISLLITHDEEIHEMNREHRGIDRATDVLSFPMLEFGFPVILPESTKKCRMCLILRRGN